VYISILVFDISFVLSYTSWHLILYRLCTGPPRANTVRTMGEIQFCNFKCPPPSLVGFGKCPARLYASSRSRLCLDRIYYNIVDDVRVLILLFDYLFYWFSTAARRQVMLESASIASGVSVAVVLVFIICTTFYVRSKRQRKLKLNAADVS